MKVYKIKTFNYTIVNFNIFSTYRGFCKDRQIEYSDCLNRFDKLYNRFIWWVCHPASNNCMEAVNHTFNNYINDLKKEYSISKHKILKCHKKIIKCYNMFYNGYTSKKPYLAGWKFKNGLKVIWISKNYIIKNK